MVTCIVAGGQLLWIKRIRTNVVALFVLSLVINVGMWFERFVIIVTSLHRDFVPSNWTMYWPTWVEYGITIGWFGLFLTAFLLFSRTLPMISIGEVKSVLAHRQAESVHFHAKPAHSAAPGGLEPEAAGPEETV
jgi:molybdopterin-containing oxidoreductase family membrane subunit